MRPCSVPIDDTLLLELGNVATLPNSVFIRSIVLVAIAAASVYLSYELIVKPRQVLQTNPGTKRNIAIAGQDKQRLEAY